MNHFGLEPNLLGHGKELLKVEFLLGSHAVNHAVNVEFVVAIQHGGEVGGGVQSGAVGLEDQHWCFNAVLREVNDDRTVGILDGKPLFKQTLDGSFTAFGKELFA